MVKLDLSFWTKASTRRKRIYSAIFVFIVAFLLTLIGSLVPISHQAAQQLVNPINQTAQQNKNSGTLPQYIFLNNFRICLIMFIPIIGPIFGLISFSYTGYILGAESLLQGVPSVFYLLLLLILPFFWLEFISYSIAISESVWLIRRLLQKRFREFKNTAILIGVCAGLLALGAIIEAWLISIGV
ncbi:MAG: stage II sporulation protein M [Candidatus Bathyarchaeia archaeon]|jgi:uncharacterized membrane protein SpoIIM required for sporulation